MRAISSIESQPNASHRRHLCVVTETYAPEVNGVALTLTRLVQGMLARGHMVSVVRPQQRQTDDLDRRCESPVTLVRGLPLPGYQGLRFGLPAGRRLRARWLQQCPDVVYVATEGPLGWSAVRTARRLEIPVVSGFHTNFHSYARHYGAGWLQHVIFRYLCAFHNRTLGTLVPSAALRDRLQSLGVKHVNVLSRGVDSGLFNPQCREMLGSLVRVPKPLHSFYTEMMQRKHDDHVASHSHSINQFFHLVSSSVFIYCYFLLFTNLTIAVCFSLAALLVRQFGHAVIEPPCHDKIESR